MFQHICREWNQEADLTHVAREKGATWKSYVIEEVARIEAVKCFFDGGVSKECQGLIQNRVGSAYVFQSAKKSDEKLSRMKWKTIIEVAKTLLDNATVTQAECNAASGAAIAICCLARTGSICFDLDGKLIEHCSRNRTERKSMEEDVGGR